MNVLPPVQGMGMGEKTAGDLYESLEVSIDGNAVRLGGSLRTVKGWKEFDAGTPDGHFVPLIFPEECVGEVLTFKNRAGGDREITLDADRIVVTRLENLASAKQEVWKDGKLYMSIDYTGLIPVGAAAYDAEKTDFGRFGKLQELTDGLEIPWDGAKAMPTGTVRFVGPRLRAKYTKLSADGNYFPVALTPWFSGTPHNIGVDDPAKTTTDKDIVFKVPDKYCNLRVKYLDVTVMDINLRHMDVEPALGENAVAAALPGTTLEYEGKSAVKVDDLIDGPLTITWTGDTEGEVTGKLKKCTMAADHFDGAQGHFLPLTVFNHDGERLVFTGVGGAQAVDTDSKCIFQLGGSSGGTKVKVSTKDDLLHPLLAELDVSKLTLAE